MSTIVVPATICAKIISRFLSNEAEREGLLLGGSKSEIISETTDSIDHKISSRESVVLQGLYPAKLSTDEKLGEISDDDYPTVQRVIGWYRCRYSHVTTISLKERYVHKRLCEQYCDPLLFVQFIVMPSGKETKICILFNEINAKNRSVRLKIPTDIVNLMDTDQTYYFQTNTGIVNFDSPLIRSLIPPSGDGFSVKHEVINSANSLFERSISRLKLLHEQTSSYYKDISAIRQEISVIKSQQKMSETIIVKENEDYTDSQETKTNGDTDNGDTDIPDSPFF